MSTLLKLNEEKVLNFFYQNKKEEIHLRELSRVTNIHVQVLSKTLKNLIKNNILKEQKKANLKLFSLKKNKKVYSLYTLFDVEKIDSLPLLRKEAIKTYLNSLKEIPIFAIIFGSTAKGNFKENSDIDILIVTYKKINTKDAEKETKALNSIKITTFQTVFEDFEKELKQKQDKVIQSALNTGIPLQNHINYYELINNE